MKEIFVIVPAWNEVCRPGRSIKKTLERLVPFGYTVVVVDDGSTDETADVARAAGSVVLRHVINRGQGAALDTGMKYAATHGASIIVHFDADGQFQAEEIADVIRPLQERPEIDVVLGSRYADADRISVPLIKQYLIHKPALLFQNLTTGLRLTDVHSGFRAFRSEAARKIQIRQDGMAHASEIVSQIARLKLQYAEVPITVTYNEFGQSFGGGLKILRSLFIRKILK